MFQEEETKDVDKANVVQHVETMLRDLESLKLEKFLGPTVISQLSDPQGVQIKYVTILPVSLIHVQFHETCKVPLNVILLCISSNGGGARVV